jgi:pimeloyl-ACP methyl ester carboxylesterase
MQTTIQGSTVFWYPGSSGLLPKPDPNKPTIVMIHGAANDHSVWTLHARYFAHHGYRVVAVDLPGHGLTTGPLLTSVTHMAHWLFDLLNSLLVGQCVVLGHSMGSLIALELAKLAANKSNHFLQLQGLALLGTAVPMPVSPQLIELIRTDPQKAIHQINFWSCSTINTHPGNPGPGFSTYNQNARLMQRQGPAVLLNDFLACNNYLDGSQALDSVRNQALSVAILAGQKDQMTPAKVALRVKDQLGQDTAVIQIPNCGHALMAEQPHAVLSALITWLDALVLRPAPGQLP